MECVTTVSYSVRFNNVPLEPSNQHVAYVKVTPYCRIYSYLLADGLSTILQKEVHEGNLQELKICRRAPRISHLLFEDDTLLFFEASEAQAQVVEQSLRRYERCTGQSSAQLCLARDAHCHIRS